MRLPIQYVLSQYDVWRDPEAGARRIRWDLYAFSVCVGPDWGWLGSVPDAPPKTVACLGDILLYMPIWRRATMECKEVCIPGWEQFQCCILTKPKHSNANLTESANWVYHKESHVLYPLFPYTCPNDSICMAYMQCVCAYFSSPDLTHLSPVCLVLQGDAYCRKLYIQLQLKSAVFACLQ